MPKAKDITGKKFGFLTAISCVGSDKNNYKLWKCKCDCGNTVIRSINLLRETRTRINCGCMKSEFAKENLSTAYENFKENNWIEGTAINSLDNKIMLKNNKSGVKGIHWDKSREKWVAQITFKGKAYNLGRYENKEDAIKARKNAEDLYFKPMIEKYTLEEDKI